MRLAALLLLAALPAAAQTVVDGDTIKLNGTTWRQNKLGVHAHPCVPAWEWRAQMRVQ